MASFEDAAPRGRSLLEISNEMVRIYKEQFGRGPTKPHTHYAGQTCSFACSSKPHPAERNVQRLGEHERLQDMRTFFQYAQARRFTEPIERITGRRVRAFISGLDTNADIASELFVLEPDPPREPPRDPPGTEEPKRPEREALDAASHAPAGSRIDIGPDPEEPKSQRS
jgi:uncharacterized protein YbcI